MEKKSVKELEKALHVEEDEEVMLPGFRFHPTDEELVAFYLRRKVEKKPLSIEIIKQVDIYKFDPWDLPKASTAGGEKEWYFFCLRGRKYRNSIRPNRVTGSGFWKATGIDRPIYSAGDAGDCIGLKKSLVYYRGSAGKGTKTDWMMHEFRLPPPPATKNNDNNTIPTLQEAEIWTICRIFKRNVTNKKFPQYWREANSKKMTTESNSKTSSSLESDAGDEYKCFVASNATQQLYPQGDLRLMSNYFDDKSQLLIPGQWNNPMPPQTPSTVMHQSIAPNPQMVEFFKDGNWDELGRMMEIMSETNPVYECRYI